MEGEVPLIDLEVDPSTGQNVDVEATPGNREPLRTPSQHEGVSPLSNGENQPTLASPKDGLQMPPSVMGRLTTTPSTSIPTPRLVHIGSRRSRVAYPGLPCNLMANLNAIGSQESLKPWPPLGVPPKRVVGGGRHLFYDNLSLHLLTSLVLPGDRSLISMAPNCVEESVCRHLSYIANVRKHLVLYIYISIFKKSTTFYC